MTTPRSPKKSPARPGTARTTASPASASPATLAAENADLQQRLALARTLNATLHRALTNGLQGPLTDVAASGTMEEVQAENTHLREQVTLLRTQLAGVEQQLGWKTRQHELESQRHEHLRKQFFRGYPDGSEAAPPSPQVSPLDVPLIEDLYTRLLTVAHPDKWQHQPAEALAHEIAVHLTALREQARRHA
jgi:hypothetical protein